MKLTEAEWQIMNALWAKHPATAGEIRKKLEGQVDWAYTTIKTMLTRLAEKGAVKEIKEGAAAVYEPLVSRQAARHSAIKSLAAQAFEGAFGPLMHFLVEDQKLSKKQREELIKILKGQHEKDGGK